MECTLDGSLERQDNLVREQGGYIHKGEVDNWTQVRHIREEE